MTMKNENECTVEGIVYVAEEYVGDGAADCQGCAGTEWTTDNGLICDELGYCHEIDREDKKMIVWVKKELDD